MNLKQGINEFRATPDYKKQSDIHWFVWLIENPKSPISLTGAVDLYNHDIIHILLNRKMEIRDEAFVIGFTMGNSSGINKYIKWLFKLIAKHLYPNGYRFSDSDIEEFNRGYAYGMSTKESDIHINQFNISENISDIRKKLGINLINT